MSEDARVRCAWVDKGVGSDPLCRDLYRDYHDTEWGVPLHDERGLFEFLILEGAQAGLSWLTILKKREGYRRAFEGFDVERIARYGEADVARLLADPGIVRNRLKIAAAIAVRSSAVRCSVRNLRAPRALAVTLICWSNSSRTQHRPSSIWLRWIRSGRLQGAAARAWPAL